jgi:ADP-ribose pyrophosphatase YjhB (NUDIX family)
MYVKTVIYNEHDKLLLLKEKREDKKQRWDLPGATFTEEQSFDETVITNVQKEIGYIVYPGKIVGIADYSDKNNKEVYVIMDGTILNGELLLSKDYETYTWVNRDRLKEYPLVPWLHNYIHNNKSPFTDVEAEIEELTNKRQRRREIIQEDLISSINSKDNGDKINDGVKSSFSLLKDTIKRTFHPRQAQVTQTTPKANELYTADVNENKNESSISDKLNIRFHKKSEEEEYIDKSILEANEGDIIIEHDDDAFEAQEDNSPEISQEDVVKEETNNEIIIDHSDDEILTEEVPDDEKIIKPMEEDEKPKKMFDTNINKQNNLKEEIKEPEIKVIHKDEKTPHIRTEKETKDRFSFNSENIIRSGWKEKLNNFNRTEANNEKKNIPRPKGKRK